LHNCQDYLACFGGVGGPVDAPAAPLDVRSELLEIAVKVRERLDADGAAPVAHGFGVRQLGEALVAPGDAPLGVAVEGELQSWIAEGLRDTLLESHGIVVIVSEFLESAWNSFSARRVYALEWR
jgi:hypothetical protein